VSPRVHRDHPEVLSQPFGDETPDPGAEAVRVVQQRQGAVPTPVEQGNLQARVGQRDPAAFDVVEHGVRILASQPPGVQPHAFRYAGEMPPETLGWDDALRERMRAHLKAFEPRSHDDPALRNAAVAVTLTSDEEQRPCFVITRRAPKLRAHSGQWALPGGRMDPGEAAESAALRELSEEIGLALGAESVLGLLDDYPTRSGYRITPVVVWAGDVARFDPDPGEVAAVYRVPLCELDRPDVPRLRSIPESDRPVISIPLLGTHIHAPTAAILYQLREVAVWGRDTRVAQFEQPVFAWR
jgi:8-oxo-dGTP pyrophosphatase MutT (NUDIX family)